MSVEFVEVIESYLYSLGTCQSEIYGRRGDSMGKRPTNVCRSQIRTITCKFAMQYSHHLITRSMHMDVQVVLLFGENTQAVA